MNTLAGHFSALGTTAALTKALPQKTGADLLESR